MAEEGSTAPLRCCGVAPQLPPGATGWHQLATGANCGTVCCSATVARHCARHCTVPCSVGALQVAPTCSGAVACATAPSISQSRGNALSISKLWHAGSLAACVSCSEHLPGGSTEIALLPQAQRCQLGVEASQLQAARREVWPARQRGRRRRRRITRPRNVWQVACQELQLVAFEPRLRDLCARIRCTRLGYLASLLDLAHCGFVRLGQLLDCLLVAPRDRAFLQRETVPLLICCRQVCQLLLL
mmetsp:Transcript_19949/g.59273  ORF Transcript_19949/g.59273 Transcript_19949/m.59273 type:complete len:244 (+) Transcript_19949:639-1370(+)